MDVLLFLMAVIWGSNYSVIKSALADFPPIAFNALRLLLASTLFLATIAVKHRQAHGKIFNGAWHRWRNSCHQVPGTDDPQPSARHRDSDASARHRGEWQRLFVLAVIGHTCYQLLFIWGLSATSASNSALIIGCTPVFVALMTAALGQETIRRRRWLGVLLSAAGVYLVVGRGTPGAGDSIAGDLLMLGAVACWSIATIIARPLLERRSALEVTGLSMAIGTLMFFPFATPQLARMRFMMVPWQAWAALAFSALLALYVAYFIWFSAVQRLGGPRTAVYSNMVPVAGLLVASFGFGEPIGVSKAIGAAIVLLGVALTRL